MFSERQIYKTARFGLIFYTAVGYGMAVMANPQGMKVQQGAATASQKGSTLNITTSRNAYIDWRTFNIAKGETTAFIQPNSKSVVWNRINDGNPSKIMGNLTANGFVVLMNNSGFFFGRDSVILTGGFIASTAPIAPMNTGGGAFWQFNGPPPTASIVNYGQIVSASGGAVYLIAEKVENHGTIMAPDGTLGLYAGKEVLVSQRPDGRGLSARVTLPSGSVDNTGKLVADAGTIAVHASVVNQNGLIQANSVRANKGAIELVAGDALNLGDSSVLSAKGGESGVSAAGTITLKSERAYSDATGAKIDVRGGSQGGNGGTVNLCAEEMPSILSEFNGGAKSGWSGGHLFIDPTFINIGTSQNGKLGNSGVGQALSGSGTLNLDVNSSFLGFSTITLQAKYDITISAAWNLNKSTGISAPGSMLTLESGRDIKFNAGSSIYAGPGWSVQMIAGADLTQMTSGTSFSQLQFNPVVAGTGSIFLNGGTGLTGSGSLRTFDGSINLRAAKDILVGTGFIRTDGGGKIDLFAQTGNVDPGNNGNSCISTPSGYVVNPENQGGIGGIGTAHGGDITITAGQNVGNVKDISLQAATVGCYEKGNLTIVAGGLVTGGGPAGTAQQIGAGFVVNDGGGVISARNIGRADSPVSLGLTKGSWTLSALENIYLNEVFNPNGALNSYPIGNGKYPFKYTYSPDASVKLFALDSVQLLGTNLKTVPGKNSGRPAIYPSILDIGKTGERGGSDYLGQIVLGNDVVLYPSPNAHLNIHTAGSFKSTGNAAWKIQMSDSDLSAAGFSSSQLGDGYSQIVLGHAPSPLQLASAGDPVIVSVGGNIENVKLELPKRSEVTVGGDAINFSLTGQNLKSDEKSVLTVKGDIKYNYDVASVPVGWIPDLSIFQADVTERSDLKLSDKLIYNAATHQLVFFGKMTVEQRNFLLAPKVQALDPITGEKLTDAKGQPVYTAISAVPPGAIAQWSAAVIALYSKTKDLPVFSTSAMGLSMGGPGEFDVTARSMDLGSSSGIRSIVNAFNPKLTQYGKGADLHIHLNNDLQMASSQIASFNGGSIFINAGGKIVVGSPTEYSAKNTPRGIYTGHGGSLDIVADGDILLSGSRIATYDGGNITVTSLKGSVDAGDGGKGYFNIPFNYWDPASQSLVGYSERYFGSGIMAFTAMEGHTVVGNITVTAEKDIIANAGGILQLLFNNSHSENALVSLNARTGKIDANESGILGQNVEMKAARDIVGKVVSSHDIHIASDRAVSVIAVAGGGATVSAGGGVSGTIVGGTAVNVSSSGGTVSASVINSSAGGSGPSSAFKDVSAPAVTKTVSEAAKVLAEAPGLPDPSEEERKKLNKKQQLAKSTGRVKVILPAN